MNEHMNPAVSLEHSICAMDRYAARSVCDRIYLPARLYEALPAMYVSVGTLFILGASYIGMDHLPMFGYLTVGVSCVVAGLTVGIVRRKERSTQDYDFA